MAMKDRNILTLQLVKGFEEGNQFQTLLGVTGSGKTFTMANVIAKLNKPTLVIAHNKTLAAQLYGEFKEFFSENAVEYFVSYYDYYQPEAYVASTDTYIEKDSSINDEIDFKRGTFRVKGDTIDIYPISHEGTGIRIEFFGYEVDRICEIDTLKGNVKCQLEHMLAYVGI